ncbi:hypothetical protein N7478_009267 [Penicillium angulare]|uniref:uncharacterized protein n=1 Tax=Penicillium angulare TaxID=116970 RepID=UPI00253FD197|nr:uncharacterized protein N7478_009267 [Penicillium angulare]KAJ5266459.1 hypothetical protein N7478_009267 [Penicillium angulare]
MSQVVFLTLDSPETPVRVDRVPQTQPAWIHPHLIESTDLVKGRQFRVSSLVPKGTCLLTDRPYAVIPVVDDPTTNENLICSNPACNIRGIGLAERCRCPNDCIPDVFWCSRTCKDIDSIRHEFECGWLKRYSKSIRTKRGEYEFGMLWLIVRLLATRQCELNDMAFTKESQLSLQRWKTGWEGISLLCGSPDTWSHERVRAWSNLVKKYVQSSPILPHGLSTESVLHLICQEEANSFGLYPRETGVFPVPKSWPDRGEQFAAAVYPTAAMANHSCSPNVS